MQNPEFGIRNSQKSEISHIIAPLYTMGVDVGSSTSKCAVFGHVGGSVSDVKLVAAAVVQGGTGTSGPDKAVRNALDNARLALSDMSFIAATGYGRNTWQPAGKTYSELSCHARGALFLCPGVRTVIDIGGQDCKAMQLTGDGRLDGFAMNDKCAAGTGRFLEVMARVLEIDLSDLGRLGDHVENVIEVTSTCTVFAESEVISQLSKGVDKHGLIAGIHRSVAVKAAGIAKRLNVEPPVFFTGGVSQSTGVVNALSRELGMEIYTEPRAQLAGAIGAALFAFDNVLERGMTIG